VKLFASFAALCLSTAAVSVTAANLDFQVIGTSTPKCQNLAQSLSQGLQLAAFSAPETHDAGNPLLLKFTLEKTLKLNQEDWNIDGSSINFNSIIAQPYEKYIHHKVGLELLTFFFSGQTTRNFTASTTIERNIGGLAQHRLSFVLLDGNYSYCLVGASIGNPVSINSSAIDITPPLVRNLELDKPNYKAGDTVTMTVTFSEPLSSLSTDHLQFSNSRDPNQDNFVAFPKYGSPTSFELTPIGQNSYQVKLQLPQATPVGSYQLWYFNRADSFGNFEGRVGHQDSTEEEMAQAMPIVVVD
jgi:hypothetical protein